jgi:transcriptional regulator with XRE-family HTH domain
VDWAQTVREWRAVSGLSLAAAGSLLGVATTTVRDWEHGRHPRDLHRRALAALLGIDDPDEHATPLRVRRDELGLTMNQFATRIHVSPATASSWERGLRRPPPEYLPHLAAALKLPADLVAAMFEQYQYPESGAVKRVALPSLRRARLRSEVTQRALAARLGISVPTLYEWESGRAVVPAARVGQVADALDVPVGVLTAPAVVQHRGTANQAALSRVRRRRGLIQRDVAARLGVSVKHLAAIEAGRRPVTLPMCLQLTRIYRCSFRRIAVAGNLTLDPLLERSRWTTGTLPTVLRLLREHRGEPAATVAAFVGIQAGTLRRWETGSGRPQLAPVSRLEKYYGLGRGELVGLLSAS